MEEKTIQECEKDLEKVTMSDLHNIIFEYQREGRMGIIRFPKRIRDLYRHLTFDFVRSKGEITSNMVDILNNTSLRYCDKKVMEINSKEKIKTCSTKHVIPPKHKCSGILPKFT